jgi:predicted component of type VI protein secretion system
MLASTRRHDVATMAALRAALADFVARLEPRAMAQGSAARDGSAIAANDWNSLAARFRSITDAPGGTLPHLFVESFARTFVVAYRQNSTEPSKT